MKKRILISVVAVIFLVCTLYFGLRSGYPRPYSEVVEASGVDPLLVYSVMKAESDFREDVVSRAGAVGLMQIKPATAEYICRREGIEFMPDQLTNGAYNVRLGCLYLSYLLGKFEVGTAIAAYNAGEGTVSEWLKNPEFSSDGRLLEHIPYPETERYVKKIEKFRKIYDFYY